MNKPVADQVTSLIAGIEPAGLAALRVGFTFAVIVSLLAGVFIFRRRHQLFDGDPNVENDVPVVRHNRVAVFRAQFFPGVHIQSMRFRGEPKKGRRR